MAWNFQRWAKDSGPVLTGLDKMPGADVLEVASLPKLLERKEELKELVLKLRCLGGKLESSEVRFDNNDVPGGFVKSHRSLSTC